MSAVTVFAGRCVPAEAESDAASRPESFFGIDQKTVGFAVGITALDVNGRIADSVFEESARILQALIPVRPAVGVVFSREIPFRAELCVAAVTVAESEIVAEHLKDVVRGRERNVMLIPASPVQHV